MERIGMPGLCINEKMKNNVNINYLGDIFRKNFNPKLKANFHETKIK